MKFLLDAHRPQRDASHPATLIYAQYIDVKVQHLPGDKAEAAEALGMSRATIYRKIKDFGIS
jgi:transcriptional regulator of acetoin/glycerol metabolism